MTTSSEIKAFNKLYEDYYVFFVYFANTYIKDNVEAEDIVAEAIMYYWEKRHSLTDNSNIPAYILEVIKHKCLNHLRHLYIREGIEQRISNHQKRVINLRISTLEACNPHSLFVAEAHQLIDEGLALMSDKTRRIFVMSRYENKTYQEIADYFSLSVKSIEFHISKALKLLRMKLKDYKP